jgi:hypothetical protein
MSISVTSTQREPEQAALLINDINDLENSSNNCVRQA